MYYVKHNEQELWWAGDEWSKNPIAWHSVDGLIYALQSCPCKYPLITTNHC